jgi:hypothetical protein
MAEVDIQVLESTTINSHTGNTNWATAESISSANIQAADYLVIGCGLFNGSTNDVGYRCECTNGITTIGNSFQELRGMNTRLGGNYGQPWAVLQKETFTGSNDFNVRYRTTNSANTVYVNRTNVVLIKVDDTDTDDDALHSGDYEISVNTSNVEVITPGNWEDLESVTIGDGSSDYLIFGRATSRGGSFGAYYDLRLVVGGTPVEEVQMKRRGTACYETQYIMRYLAAPATDTVVELEFRTDSSLADIWANGIVAIRLNAFDDYAGIRATPALDIDNEDEDHVAATLTHTTNHTSGSAEDWIFFGWSQIDDNESEKSIDTYMDQGATPTTIAGTHTGRASTRFDDDSPYPITCHGLIGTASVANSTDVDVELGHQEENSATTPSTIQIASIVGFTKEKASEQTGALLLGAASNAGF